jgi:predicted esterase
MVYLMNTMAPEFVTGGVAAAGWLPRPLWNPNMAPTVAYHGEQDATVPFGPTAEYWAAMRDRGATISVDSFDQGHGAGGAIYGATTRGVNFLLDSLPKIA